VTSADRYATRVYTLAMAFAAFAQGDAIKGIDLMAQAAEYLHSEMYLRVHRVWGIYSLSREIAFDQLELQ